MGIKEDLLQLFISFSYETSASLPDKSVSGSGVANNEIKQNRHPLDLAMLKLAKELHKPIIRNFQKREVYTGFKGNILALI